MLREFEGALRGDENAQDDCGDAGPLRGEFCTSCVSRVPNCPRAQGNERRLSYPGREGGVRTHHLEPEELYEGLRCIVHPLWPR